jgi:hypothetical protein
MLWALELKIFYIYIFLKPRIIGKYREDIGGCWKGPKKYFCLVMKNIKKDIPGVKNISVLKLMKMKIISWAIYMIMDY